MSGGHWDYQQKHLDLLIEQLPTIIKFVQDCLNEVDLSLSGDKDQERVKETLFSLTATLGDQLYSQ